MQINKSERLGAIKDEVNDFHPLLELLLPKLSRIKEVQYTHGSNEMGADFVISRMDDTFGDIEYIGIIAKVGKIVQDFMSIERQIDECAIERFFLNGRKKIYISEVWVINNSTITQGAQAKIHEKYKTRKIIFIDGARLINLIEQHLPNYWSNVKLAIGDYLYSIWNDNEKTDKALSFQICKHSFYINQDIYEADTIDKKHRKKAKLVNIFDEIIANKILLIEGGMGAGKSKLMRRIVDHFAHPQEYLKNNLIPLVITFKDFIGKYNYNPRTVIESLVPPKIRNDDTNNCHYLFLLDGADEINQSAAELAASVVKVANIIKSESKIKAIITSRWCDAYETNPELSKSLARLEIRPLSNNRIIEFIECLCSGLDLKTRLLEDLRKSSLFRELPKSPIAAILLAQLLNENSKELPANLTELYTKYVEISLGRWDIEKGLQTQKDFEALLNILTKLATYFLENQIQGIAENDALQFFKDYLDVRNFDINVDILFRNLTNRSDIVVLDQNKIFRFKHKTFIEYFYARNMYKQSIKIDSRVWNPYWTTSYYFQVGLRKDCPDLLEAILNVKATNEGERWMRLVNIPNYLLAGFASPYNITQTAIQIAMKEATELYQDIHNKKIVSPFTLISPMRFLWCMQMLIRKNYGYNFFKNALIPATIEIESSGISREDCAISLFFLTIVSRELGVKDCFDYLLKQYSHDLPIEFELGISHEHEGDDDKSILLKKLEKQFTRSLKGNPRLRQQIEELYSSSICKIK
ncbi:MAG: NACHT domain-containing protein [Verrucomicrobiota bacterium]|nr:NACHT domain-containing protein [Verrucomicrobiota bacterium]